jgi:hypothetical protein
MLNATADTATTTAAMATMAIAAGRAVRHRLVAGPLR